MKLICTVRNNSGAPRFSYYLYSNDNPIREGDGKWNHPVPMNRKHLSSPDDSSFTFGTYFHALTSFLRQDDFRALRTGLSDISDRVITSAEIGDIRICMEKHGEFYHPARIEVRGGGFSFFFVINGAVSHAGMKNIGREYALLENMQDRFPFPFLPKVWDLGTGECPDGTTVPMFLGQWFDGFHEFHIAASSPASRSVSPEDRKQRITVWAPEGHFYLNPEQKAELYRQIAMILTVCYDVETFRYIFPWHHAAGDFILKTEEGGLRVKLITLRQYLPIVNTDPEDADESDLIQALLLFLLHLSLHTRLDRVEGTGELVWAEDTAVRPTLEGFFLGLRQKEAPWSDTLPQFFLQYLCRIPEDRMEEAAFALAETYPDASPEHKIIRENLKRHVEKLFQVVNEGIDL